MIVLRPPGGRQRTDERTRLGSDARIARAPLGPRNRPVQTAGRDGGSRRHGPARPRSPRTRLGSDQPDSRRAARPCGMPTDAAVRLKHDRARSTRNERGPERGPDRDGTGRPAPSQPPPLPGRRSGCSWRTPTDAPRKRLPRKRPPRKRPPRKRPPRKATAATAATAQADPDGRTRRARLGRRPWPARAAPRLPEPRKPQWRRRQAAAAAAARSPFGSPLHLGSDAACEDGIRCEDDGARLMMVRDGGVAWHPCASRLDAAAHAHGCAARLFGIVAIGTTLAPADSIYFT